MCTDLSVGSWEGEVNEFKSAVCVNVGRMQEWGGVHMKVSKVGRTTSGLFLVNSDGEYRRETRLGSSHTYQPRGSNAGHTYITIT